MTDFELAVLDATRKIKRGRVSTYQEIARFIGKPGSARAVGNALHKNPWAPQVPCHRVVKSGGQIGGFASGSRKKARMLNNEGVKIKDGRVEDFAKKLYRF